MKRPRAWLKAAVALSFVAALLILNAQPPAKAARIGVLTLSTATWTSCAGEFRQALREQGYTEGRNVVIDHRDAAGRAERLPALAAELVRRNVDVIVTQSNVAALAAKQATRSIPS